MLKLLPGVVGAACLVAGVTLRLGVAVGLVVAGVLLLIVDRRA